MGLPSSGSGSERRTVGGRARESRGLKPRHFSALNVRAEARTYLRSNGDVSTATGTAKATARQEQRQKKKQIPSLRCGMTARKASARAKTDAKAGASGKTDAKAGASANTGSFAALRMTGFWAGLDGQGRLRFAQDGGKGGKCRSLRDEKQKDSALLG
jgi:hypothetical protein